MTVGEAIKWLDPYTRKPMLDNAEDMSGIDIVDYVVGEFNEACKIAVKIMRESDYDPLEQLYID